MVGVLRPRPPGFRPTEETAARTIHQSDIHPLILLCNRQDGKLFIASCKKKVFISLLMVRFSLFHMIIIELSTLLCLKAESLVNNRFHTVVIRIYNMCTCANKCMYHISDIINQCIMYVRCAAAHYVHQYTSKFFILGIVVC